MDREKLRKENKKELKALGIGAIALVVVLVFLGVWLGVEPSVEPKITFEGTVLRVHGIYPKRIELAGAAVALTDAKLPVDKRIAGSNYPNKHVSKGKYRSSDTGETVYLSCMDTRSPYIVIDNGRQYFINRKSRDDTLALFEKIKILAERNEQTVG